MKRKLSLFAEPARVPAPTGLRLVSFACPDDDAEEEPQLGRGQTNAEKIADRMKASTAKLFCSSNFLDLDISLPVASQTLLRMEQKNLITYIETRGGGGGRGTKYYRWRE